LSFDNWSWERFFWKRTTFFKNLKYFLLKFKNVVLLLPEKPFPAPIKTQNTVLFFFVIIFFHSIHYMCFTGDTVRSLSLFFFTPRIFSYVNTRLME